VAGLVSIAFGAVIVSRPGIGAVTIALLFGLFSLMYGFSQIVTGTQLHQARHVVRAAVEDAA